MKIRHLLMAIVAVAMMAASASAATPNPVKTRIDSKINWGLDGGPANVPTLREVKQQTGRDRIAHERQMSPRNEFCERSRGACGGYAR